MAVLNRRLAGRIARLVKVRSGGLPVGQAYRGEHDLELAEHGRQNPLGTWRWQVVNDQMQWSEQTCRIFGFDPAGPAPSLGQHRAFCDAASFDRLEAALLACAKNGQFFELEMEIRHRSGGPRWILVHGESQRDATGNVQWLRGTALDVTGTCLRAAARARTDQEASTRLREIEQAYRQAPVALFACDRELRYQHLNERMAALSGLPVEAHVGATLWELNPGIAPGFAELARQVLERGESVIDREFAEPEDFSAGAGRDWLLSGYPRLDGTGETIGLFGVMVDITERKRVERTLTEMQGRFRVAMRKAPIGEALIGLDGGWNYVNDAFCAMLGRSEDRLLGRTLEDLMLASDYSALADQVATLLAGSADTSGKLTRLLHADGHLIEIQIDMILLRGAGGQPIQVFAQFQDVTQRRRLERQREDLAQRLSLAVKVSRMGVWDWDLVADSIHCDEQMHRIFGLRSGSADDAADWRKAIHVDDAARCQADLKTAIASRTAQSLKFRMLHPRLGLRYIEGSVGVVLDEEQVVRVVGVTLDVTERWQAEQRISADRALLRNVIDNLPVGVSLIDRNGRYVVTNRRNARLIGLPVEQIEGRYFRKILPPPLLEPLRRIWEHVTVGETVDRCDEFEEDGKLTHVQETYLPISGGPQAGSMLAVFSDVSLLKQSELRLNQINRQLEQHVAEIGNLQQQLNEQVVRDGLTGLHNRRYFDAMLAHELERSSREGHCLSLIMADLDHFKALNDRYGHQGGDAMLQAWSALLCRNMRSSDVLCRYGGEEFVMILPQCSLDQAAERAESLRCLLHGLTVPCDGHELPMTVTVSMGIASTAPSGRTAAELIRAADQALYRAKTRGRNQVVRESH